MARKRYFDKFNHIYKCLNTAEENISDGDRDKSLRALSSAGKKINSFHCKENNDLEQEMENFLLMYQYETDELSKSDITDKIKKLEKEYYKLREKLLEDESHKQENRRYLIDREIFEQNIKNEEEAFKILEKCLNEFLQTEKRVTNQNKLKEVHNEIEESDLFEKVKKMFWEYLRNSGYIYEFDIEYDDEIEVIKDLNNILKLHNIEEQATINKMEEELVVRRPQADFSRKMRKFHEKGKIKLRSNDYLHVFQKIIEDNTQDKHLYKSKKNKDPSTGLQTRYFILNKEQAEYLEIIMYPEKVEIE